MTPTQARYLLLAEYVADSPCKRGHQTLRSVSNGVCKDCQKLSTKGWHDKNPWFIYKFKHRMPKWADKEQIRHFYEQAKLLTQTTGVAHEVDHIVPLNGKYVSGLHVPHNMRVITKEENYAKLATHESDFNF